MTFNDCPLLRAWRCPGTKCTPAFDQAEVNLTLNFKGQVEVKSFQGVAVDARNEMQNVLF